MVKLTEDLVLARCRSCDLENVRKLNCWASELDDITIMRKLTSIEVVSLSVNEITTLEDFQNCKNLQELYIRKNSIRNLNEICYLKKLPKLRILWLADNPCAVGSSYRMTVLKNLPNLTKLDNMVVEEDELNDAFEQGHELRLPTEKPPLPPNKSQSTITESNDPTKLTSEETNKIREELGLKPLPEEKLNTPSKIGSGSRHRNANILHAVLALVKELDGESLEEVIKACRDRMDSL